MAITDNVIHSGTAPDTTLAADITTGSATITITSGTGYPSPTGGQIAYVTIAKATSAEELVSYTGRSGTSLTGCIRGLGGTSAAAHLAGVSVYHGWTAIEADDANTAVRNTVGKVTTAGDTLVATAAGVFKRLALGAAYKALGVNAAGTDLTYLDTLASILTATGDIPYASGASTPARLAKSTGWRALGMNDAGTLPAYASGFPGFVFADATARDAAIVTPIKGMAAWLTGTGTIARTVYDGTAWRVWEVWGTGAPESAITAPISAVYHRTDGGASTSLYVKESGTGNTGWIAYGAATATGPKELGYTDVTAAQTAIGTSTTDLTSLTVTVTCDGTTPIMITGYVPYFTKNTAAGYAQLFIYESTTELVNAVEDAASGGLCQPGPVMRRITPSAGSHTYKLRANAGNNTVDMFAAATERAFIRVEEVKT